MSTSPGGPSGPVVSTSLGGPSMPAVSISSGGPSKHPVSTSPDSPTSSPFLGVCYRPFSSVPSRPVAFTLSPGTTIVILGLRW